MCVMLQQQDAAAMFCSSRVAQLTCQGLPCLFDVLKQLGYATAVAAVWRLAWLVVLCCAVLSMVRLCRVGLLVLGQVHAMVYE
jgi:hypothetical protein